MLTSSTHSVRLLPYYIQFTISTIEKEVRFVNSLLIFPFLAFIFAAVSQNKTQGKQLGLPQMKLHKRTSMIAQPFPYH